MLRPFILVGVGGSGGKTLRVVREDLLRLLKQTGKWERDDLPAGWQFLHIDVPTHADGDEVDLPDQLPDAQYKGMVAPGIGYSNIDEAILQRVNEKSRDVFGTWRPDPIMVHTNPATGAGQFRAIGRMITISGLRQINEAVQKARAAITGTSVVGEMQEVTRLLGGEPKPSLLDPTVIVVSSIAGGTGAGAVVDICNVIRALPDKWANEIVGVLYAPDVFDYLADTKRLGVRANSLASISELLNGYWNTNRPSAAQQALFGAYGVTLTNGRSGPRYPFLVGAKNEHVTYKSQNDVYRAMGRSLAAWVASEKLQDSFGAYLAGNWESTNIGIPDVLPLHPHGTATPFSAIGSARVSLGRDRFAVYAAQHLARTVVNRMLDEHETHRRAGDDRTSRQIITDQARVEYAGFQEQTGLAEGDIITTLRAASLKARGNELRAKLIKDIGQQLAVSGTKRKAGLRVSAISQQVLATLQNHEQDILNELRVETQNQARHWSAEIQTRVMNLVARRIGLSGGPVTEAVLNLLIEELRNAATNLTRAAYTSRGHSDTVRSQIAAVLGDGKAVLTSTTDPIINRAIENAIHTVGHAYEAELHDLVSQLLPDLIAGFLEPLRDAVLQAHERLAIGAKQTNSLVSSWPEDRAVLDRLLPAPNEFLLEEPEAYPDILSEQLQRTINPPPGVSARREAEFHW